MLIQHFLQSLFLIDSLKDNFRDIFDDTSEHIQRKTTSEYFWADNKIKLSADILTEIELEIIEQPPIIEHFEQSMILLISEGTIVDKDSLELSLVAVQDIFIWIHRDVNIGCYSSNEIKLDINVFWVIISWRWIDFLCFWW